MMYIFTLLTILFLPILSLKEIKPKLCINCKYFIPDTSTNTDKFSKCSLFPKEENNIFMLVNGICKDENIEYNYCLTTRRMEHMCGLKGKMYKKKYIKKH